MDEQHLVNPNGVNTSAGGKDPAGSAGDHGKDAVSIKVNDATVEIHRGRQPVSEIKWLGGVPAADELAQVTEGQPLKPLADDGSVVIKGGEEFVSYPKDSSSSFVAPVE